MLINRLNATPLLFNSNLIRKSFNFSVRFAPVKLTALIPLIYARVLLQTNFMKVIQYANDKLDFKEN